MLKLIIRSPFFIWCFRWIHPTISYKIGRRISRSGRHPAHSEESKIDIRNELKQAALNQFDKGFDYMISGHYHLGEMIQVKQGKLAVLGDWIHKPTYAIFDGNDLSMHSWGDDA